MKRTSKLTMTLLAVVIVTIPGLLGAQVGLQSDSGGSVRSRDDLETLLRQYEEVLQSPAYSAAMKADTRLRSGRVRERLTRGDFRLGDAIALFVQGELALPDTVAVQSGATGPTISLPLFGDIPLDGVLRSEITEHITQALSQFIRDPLVRAEGLMRISVQGAVGQPGFYVVPADMLISETLMVAGGPGPNSALDELRVERGVEVLLEGEALQEELRRGTTLDQLNLQAGDQLFLPPEGAGGGFFGNLGLIVGLVSSVTLIIVQLAR